MYVFKIDKISLFNKLFLFIKENKNVEKTLENLVFLSLKVVKVPKFLFVTYLICDFF